MQDQLPEKNVANEAPHEPTIASRANLRSSSFSGMRLSADFISPMIVGIFLGFWLDRWSATTPLFLLIFFFLGILAGFWNLYRMAQRLEKQNDEEK